MKIGVCQLDIQWENKDKNYLKVKKFVEDAALSKADLILFPEMTLTGFSMNIEKTKEFSESCLDRFRELSIKENIGIGIGWVKANGIKAENHYSIIDSKGNIISDYIKIHPFRYGNENKYFIGGNELFVTKINDMNIGTAICYDLRFPEIFQKMSKEASIILVPANWPAKRKEHWKCLLKARAIENQVYIIGINCVGKMDDKCYSGDSCIINPLGEVMKMSSNVEELFFGELENDVQSYRDIFPVKFDRREDIYKKYYV